MFKIRPLACAAAAAALLLTGVGAAQADPPVGVQAAPTDNVSISSVATQNFGDRLSVLYNATAPTGPKYYNWDSIGPIGQYDTIPVKRDPNCTYSRPFGSTAAIAQLETPRRTASGAYCVDLALSTRDVTADDGRGLAALQFGRDLVTWAAPSDGNAVANLTDAELRAIFSCDATRLPAGDFQHTGAVAWRDLTLEHGTSPDLVVPVLPWIAGSETRTRWLAGLGISAMGACGIDGLFNDQQIEEDQGSQPVFTAGTSAQYKDLIFPYSASHYICQTVSGCAGNAGPLTARQIDGVAPITATHTLNTATFPGSYINILYVVFRNAGSTTTPLVPPNLVPLLGQGRATGFICGTVATSAFTGSGLATVPNCGAIRTTT
ncbi:hypothetical protein GCM10009839_54070 [Catenulispora yoronensis]|uniref:DUF11 domain-containing protein n=1 Tax=Catenulispora yoronensis TaxID=450799 RepID=A0ABN2UUQ7_9ACTN